MRKKNNTLWLAGLLVVVSVLLSGWAPLEAGSRHRRGNHGSHHGSRVSFHVYPFSGYWGHRGYWGPWAYGGHYGGYYGPHAYPRSALAMRDIGAIDLKVQPKKTSVYVDGELAGNAGRFDGFPGYLWLDEGEHQIVLEHDGYLTVVKLVEVREGTLSDIRLEMKPGESRPAEEFFQPEEQKQAGTRAVSSARSAYQQDREQDKGAVEETDSSQSSSEARSLDARDESARLSVEITPDDASVYLDGRFLGTVADLTRLHAGILVSPGAHTVSAVRPGYVESEVDFEIESAEDLVLTIDLRPE